MVPNIKYAGDYTFIIDNSGDKIILMLSTHVIDEEMNITLWFPIPPQLMFYKSTRLVASYRFLSLPSSSNNYIVGLLQGDQATRRGHQQAFPQDG